MPRPTSSTSLRRASVSTLYGSALFHSSEWVRSGRWLIATITGASLVSCASLLREAPDLPEYPHTATVDSVLVLHGMRIPEPYRWLDFTDRPEVTAWVDAQKAFTESHLSSLPDREAFHSRLSSLWNHARTGVPSWIGGRWYYTRNTGLQRQNVWYASESLDGLEEMVLDPNELWPEGDIALSGFAPSPDGRFLAYGESKGGADWITYVVRDLRTGKITRDTVRWARFSDPAWTHDGNGFFYSRYPEPEADQHLTAGLAHHSVYYHRIGTPQSEDVKVYARSDQPSWLLGWPSVDETGRYLIVFSSPSTSKTTVAVSDMGDALRPTIDAPFSTIVSEPDADYWPMGVVAGKLFMHTNLDAPNRRVVTVPLASPGLEHWETVIPEGDMPIWAELVAGRIAVLTIRNVASEIRIHRLDGAVEREIPLPGLGATGGLMGRFDRPELFYTYADPLTPHTIYRYDAARDESRPFDSPTLKFDPVLFRTDRVFFESKDGTRVPMFITRRRDLAMDGRNPTLLWGYGGFGGSLRPSFSPHVIAWIERGGVYVTANLRGGGEYGQSWHEAGRLERKQNVFDDFIAAAEYLIRERYTSPRHLAINGHSNGGLLVGAVMVQRPDLFAAAVPEIGVLDMLRYHEFTGGGLWGAEYGVATDPDAFQWLRAYSPVHNVRRGVCHPATLVMTADHDDRVVPSHSYKFAAALQAAQSAVWGCERPVLLRIESRASHSYSPLDQRIALRAHVLAFVAQHTGMAPAKW
jgi:prolyl oligopeptidase